MLASAWNLGGSILICLVTAAWESGWQRGWGILPHGWHTEAREGSGPSSEGQAEQGSPGARGGHSGILLHSKLTEGCCISKGAEKTTEPL